MPIQQSVTLWGNMLNNIYALFSSVAQVCLVLEVHCTGN